MKYDINVIYRWKLYCKLTRGTDYKRGQIWITGREKTASDDLKRAYMRPYGGYGGRGSRPQ